MTVAEALAAGASRLAAAGIPAPARDARRLLAHALNAPVDRLTLMSGDAVAPALADRYAAALAAREAWQPVSQIVGWREFYGRRFRVTPDVLDPRPETEMVVEVALRKAFVRVLDLGTGSGCLLLTLLAEREGAHGTGTDISSAALRVAEANARQLSLDPEFLEADWFEGLVGRWDLIVSNPPYIADSEMADLQPDVRLWEPRMALTPGGDGLGAYRRIAAAAPRHLTEGGRLVLEIGPTQAAEVRTLLLAAGLTGIEVHRDLDGRDRVVSAVLTA